MKQLLFLLLFPCLALAQYTGNAGQKITLGEQTTADGLVYRGIRADTASKIVPFSDTSAYIILDTVEKTLWLYKAGQVPKWQQVGGSASGGGTVTSITGGTGLTGGTITTSGTLSADTSFLFTQSDTLSLNLTNRFAAKQNNITLTTTGTSGAATLTGATLNIPQYSGGGGISDGDKGDIDVTNSGATWTIDTSAISLSGNKVTGTLPVANGGTGGTTYGDSTLLQGRGTSAISSSTDLLFNYTTKTLKVNGLYIGLGNSNVSSNIKIGNLATLSKNAAGGNTNTAIGAFALENNTTGDENLAFGSYAMGFNTTGGYSVAIGANALYKATTANFNCAIGRSSLQELKTGTKNVAIGGTDSGYATDSTNNSTIIGTEAGGITTLLTGGTNNTILGYRAISSTGTVSNEMTLGNSSIATIRAQVTTITSLSDARDKSDIIPLNYGMNFIEKLKPVSFVWNMRDGGKIGIFDIGFIAQDLQKAQIDTNVNVPNLVSGTEDKLEAGYGVLLPIIVKALQEANDKIKSLEQRIINLENK